MFSYKMRTSFGLLMILLLLPALFLSYAFADIRSNTNFRIETDVINGGGGLNYLDAMISYGLYPIIHGIAVKVKPYRKSA